MKKLTMRQREQAAGYLFIAPTYLFYIAFMILPLVATVYFSFTKYNVIKPAEWIGLKNYVQMFKDTKLPTVSMNTVKYTALTTVLKTVFSLVLAILLNSRNLFQTARNVSRAAFFFPYIVAMSYVSLIWSFMFSRDLGVVNYLLNQVGIQSVPWFTDMKLALYMLIVLDVWKNVGYGMLVFLAGLQGISKDYYEAAVIDGASRWKLTRHITLPLLRPMTVMMVILNTIHGLQAFDSMSVITEGGPGISTKSILLYIYEKGFQSYNMGYAAALSFILIIVILIVSLIQLRFDKSVDDA